MAGLSNTHFISMRAVGQLAPRIHINQSQILWICLLSPAIPPPPQYISRSQYVRYSCEQGWEGDRGRGNKGLTSLAKRGWRLRQMAWSLQHSGVARLVLKSSSLTFQQILPGGWGVCHTTPRIHTAPHHHHHRHHRHRRRRHHLPSEPPRHPISCFSSAALAQHEPLTALHRIPSILSSRVYTFAHYSTYWGGSLRPLQAWWDKKQQRGVQIRRHAASTALTEAA